MADRSIARRYAKAFVELADETGTSPDALTEALDRAVAAFDAHEGLLFGSLANPVFGTDERRRVLDEVLPKIGVSGLTRNLLHVLLEKGRFGQVHAVRDVVRELADERADRIRIRVDTAEPLSPQLEAEVRAAFERITKKTVLLDTRVDRSLIGGIVARVGSRVYDASIRSRLADIKKRLLAERAPAEA